LELGAQDTLALTLARIMMPVVRKKTLTIEFALHMIKAKQK
jgi:hypothetical protein